MNFASYEQHETYDSPEYHGFEPSSVKISFPVKSDPVKIFTDKFLVPPLTMELPRPRLIEHTRRLLAQFSATLVTGRAGTGKTVLAAQLGQHDDLKLVWYKVETADNDWKIFASYLLGSLNQNSVTADGLKFDELKVAAQSELIAAKFNEAAEKESLLIVLDDLHSVFDAPWFAEFFNAFVPSLSSNTQLLLIARTLPPLAVWRLRSKQVLGVVEEKLLAFTQEETVRLFHTHHLAPKTAHAAHQSAFGKISRLREIIEAKSE